MAAALMVIVATISIACVAQLLSRASRMQHILRAHLYARNVLEYYCAQSIHPEERTQVNDGWHITVRTKRSRVCARYYVVTVEVRGYDVSATLTTGVSS